MKAMITLLKVLTFALIAANLCLIVMLIDVWR